MKSITFVLSGETAFFRKPEVNIYCHFTFSNIHKIALLGLLGAVIGLDGHAQQYMKNNHDKDNLFPEFYEKLKDLKVAIVPLTEDRVFTKKIHVFTNSIGFASKEKGGTLIVRQQWLENPSWRIFILDDNSIDLTIFNKLKESLRSGTCTYIPYLGTNNHFASIDKYELIDLMAIDNIKYIHSLFPLETVKLKAGENKTYDEKSPYLFQEFSPFSLRKQDNAYEYIELGSTNIELENDNSICDAYSYDERILLFF